MTRMASRRELTACGSLRGHSPADATTILLAAPAMSFRLDAGGWCGRARVASREGSAFSVLVSS